MRMNNDKAETDQNEEDEGPRVRRGWIRVEVEMSVVDGVGSGVRSCRRGQIVDAASPTKSI